MQHAYKILIIIALVVVIASIGFGVWKANHDISDEPKSDYTPAINNNVPPLPRLEAVGLEYPGEWGTTQLINDAETSHVYTFNQRLNYQFVVSEDRAIAEIDPGSNESVALQKEIALYPTRAVFFSFDRDNSTCVFKEPFEGDNVGSCQYFENDAYRVAYGETPSAVNVSKPSVLVIVVPQEIDVDRFDLVINPSEDENLSDIIARVPEIISQISVVERQPEPIKPAG